MSYCANCGASYREGAKFCPACGTSTEIKKPVPAPSPIGDIAAGRRVLETMYRHLKYQRVASVISGLYLLIFGIFILIFGAVTFVSAIPGFFDFTFEGFWGLVRGIAYTTAGLFYIPSAIVCLAMGKKVKRYMSGLFVDVRPAEDYCLSAKRIVVCLFFNLIGMIFCCVGRSYVKANAEILKQIKYNQRLSADARATAFPSHAN